jgi:dienelactone hydrolase
MKTTLIAVTLIALLALSFAIPMASAGWFDWIFRRPAPTSYKVYKPSSGSGPWDGIVFMHGAMSSGDYSKTFLQELANKGFCVVAPSISISYSYSSYVNAINKAVNFLSTYSQCTGSIGVAGHSMGGYGALMAARSNSKIKAVVGIAAYIQSTWPASSLYKPTRFIHASGDPLASYSRARSFYYRIPVSKSFKTISASGFTSHMLGLIDLFPNSYWRGLVVKYTAEWMSWKL